MSNQQKTLDARGLARLLSTILFKSESTIYRDISRNPGSLPPPSIKSGRKKIWFQDDVYEWLKGGKVVTNPPPKKRTLAEDLICLAGRAS